MLYYCLQVFTFQFFYFTIVYKIRVNQVFKYMDVIDVWIKEIRDEQEIRNDMHFGT